MSFPYDKITVGTCSCCGGAVQVPKFWMSVVPAVPTCSTCGAVAVQDHGPLIQTRKCSSTSHTDVGRVVPNALSTANIIFKKQS